MNSVSYKNLFYFLSNYLKNEIQQQFIFHHQLQHQSSLLFFFSKFEELLGVSYRDIFLKSNCLFKPLLFSLFVFVSIFSYLFGTLKFLGQFELISQFDLVCLEFCLFILKPLLLLKQFLILETNCISFIGPFSRKGR